MRAFARAYSRHPAGLGHRLLVVYNGFAGDAERSAARDALGGLGDAELHLPRPVLDLAAYRRALADAVEDKVVFLNSYAQVQADGWLAALAAHLDAPGVGAVGATGSWESSLSPARLPLRTVRFPRFGPFPNPHLRTNAFALRRDLALALRWPRVRRKSDAWALENGRRGLSRQVHARGLATRVVGRDGRAYPPVAWRAARTYRAGEQENLLVADNRTELYARAGADERAFLERLAWGTAERDSRRPAPLSPV